MIRPMISIQALDALAAEYVAFEATMANVTSEHEAGNVLHAASLEVAEEIERTQKDQGRLQDDLDSATKEFSDFWAAHEATGVKLCNVFREVCNRLSHPALQQEVGIVVVSPKPARTHWEQSQLLFTIP